MTVKYSIQPQALACSLTQDVQSVILCDVYPYTKLSSNQFNSRYCFLWFYPVISYLKKIVFVVQNDFARYVHVRGIYLM